MLIGFLARHADSCVYADLSDPATRYNLEHTLLPKLTAHRRDLVQGLLWQRKSSRPLAKEDMRDLLLEVGQCRNAVRTAKRRLAVFVSNC